MNSIRRRACTMALVAASVTAMLATPAVADEAEPTVTFGTANPLEDCVRETLGVPEVPVPLASLANLEELFCDSLTAGAPLDLTPLSAANALRSLRVHQSAWVQPTLVMPSTGLESLEALDIAGYAVTGATTHSAPSLTTLSLAHTDASGLAALTASTALSSVHVAGPATIGALADLRAYAVLESFTAQDLSSFDLALLPTTPSLATIHALRTPLTGWESLRGLTGLRFVSIVDSGVTSAAGPLNALTVQRLDLSSNAISDVSGFGGLPDLVALDLSGNEITDARPLIGLPNDPIIKLPYNHITDARNLQTESGYINVYDQRLESGVAIVGEPMRLPTIIPATGESVTWSAHASAYDFSGPAPYPAADFTGTTMTVLDSPGLAQVKASWSTEGEPHTSGLLFVDLIRRYSPAPVAAITGGTVVGNVLTAAVTGADAEAHVTYQWYRDGVKLTGATAATRTLSYSDGGHALSVVASIASASFVTTTAKSRAVAIPRTLTPKAPTISGSAKVGYVLTAVSQTYPSGTVLTYQWKRDGAKIAGATKKTYKVVSADSSHRITVQVTAKKSGYVSRVVTSPSATVWAKFSSVLTLGRINPTATSRTIDTGTKLTLTRPTYKGVTPTSFTYQWTSNGVAIPGATSSSYTPTTTVAGTAISVKITAHRSGYVDSTSTARDVFTVRSIFSAKPTPVITGAPVAGDVLTVATGAWSPSASTLTYQWYRNGVPVSGATQATHASNVADGTATYAVKVTAQRSGYTTASQTSAPVTLIGKVYPTTAPSLSSYVTVRGTLTLNPGVWSPSDTTLTYQWYRNGVELPGAAGTSLVTGVLDAYSTYSVTVTATRPGYVSSGVNTTTVTVYGRTYSNCDAMRADYPGGVARDASVRDRVGGVLKGGIGSTTFVSSSLYWANSNRDGDEDGWACEPN